MSTFSRRIVIGVCSLLLLLIVSGFYFVLRPQGSSKTTLTRSSSAATTVRPTPTLQALFSENFADNSQNWDVGNGPGYGSVIGNGALTMTGANHKTFREPLPTSTSYSDFMITISFTLLKGDQNDSVGLYLRATGDMGQGYYVDIYGNDTYDLAKVTVDANQKAHTRYITEPASTSALHTKGLQNTLTIIMKGSNIILIINDSVVRSVSDSEFTNGKITLFVENSSASSGVAASFDSVTVYAAPEQLPS